VVISGRSFLSDSREFDGEGRNHCALCKVRVSGHCGAIDDGDGRSLAALDAAHAPLRVLQAGETIYHQGDRSDRLFNLLSGWVALQQDAPDGQRHILQFVLPGGSFGLGPEGSVLGHSAMTLTTTTLCMIRRTRHDQLRLEHPDFNERFLWLIQRDVRVAQDNLGNMAHGSAAARVAHLVWELAIRSLGRRPSPGERIWAPITQVHLAMATGLTPIHVNRVLRRFRQQDLMELRSQGLIVHDPRALEQLSGASEDLIALWRQGPQVASKRSDSDHMAPENRSAI
jgi:CRP/FNR family transcriptional regulator